jgi:CubicO group peptidase (beta-lactamase class C family)
MTSNKPGSLQWQAALKQAHAIFDDWHNSPDSPGAALVLFDTQGIHGQACAGLADIACGSKFTLDTVVRYASLSKHLFAALALLRSGCKLDLKSTLGDFLPQLQRPMSQVTVGQALDMTGGLPDVRESLSLLGVSAYQRCDAKPILDFLANDGSVNFTPGSEISYSNTGYRLVETILQQQGVRFADLLSQYVCQPLNIQLYAPDSWFDIVPQLAPGYLHTDSGWQTACAGLHLSASGCVAGSLRALTRWLQSLLADSGPGQQVLSYLTQRRCLSSGQTTDYGLGIARLRLGKHTLYGHGGMLSGYRSHFLLHPQLKVGVALVSNREDCNAFLSALKVMATLLNCPLPSPAHNLPDGLYVSETSPHWLCINQGVANFLGSEEVLFQGEQENAVSLSAHLPMDLRWNGQAIEGEIGHVARYLSPVDPHSCLGMVQGRWRHETTLLEICGNHLSIGGGPIRLQATLSSLGQGRLLAEYDKGSGKGYFGLYFRGYSVQLVSNRSRYLRFTRDKCSPCH